MIPLFYDLHIHSCLSPCGDDDMTPANLVGMAAVKGLDVIALTDHNSCANCPAAMYHGENYGVTVIPGMELTTAEEVHVRVCSPIIRHPCHLGIDMQTSGQLIANGKSEEQICESLGADSLKYLTVEQLISTCASAGVGFCTGCFTGDYPYPSSDSDDKFRLE